MTDEPEFKSDNHLKKLVLQHHEQFERTENSAGHQREQAQRKLKSLQHEMIKYAQKLNGHYYPKGTFFGRKKDATIDRALVDDFLVYIDSVEGRPARSLLDSFMGVNHGAVSIDR